MSVEFESDLDRVSEARLEHDTNARRNLEVLREFAARAPEGKPRAVSVFSRHVTARLG